MERPHPQTEAEATASAILPEGEDAELIPQLRARPKSGASSLVKRLLLTAGLVGFALLAVPVVPRVAAAVKETLQIKEPAQEPVTPIRRFPPLGLPTLEEAEERMPEAAKEGKQFLAEAVSGDKEPVPHDSPLRSRLADLAKGLSHGKTDQLVGIRVPLRQVSTIHDPETEGEAHATVKITRVIGLTPTDVLLEVLDETSFRSRVLRVFTEDVRCPTYGYKSIKERFKAELNLEMHAVRQACGDIPPNRAVEQRGFSVPYLTARFEEFVEVTTSGSIHFFNKVQLMDPFRYSVDSLTAEEGGKKGRLSAGAKEYVARRLLLEALYLQETGVVHNAFNLGNAFIRSDGSVILGNFSTGTMFESLRKVSLPLDGRAVEPQTAAEYLEARGRHSAFITGDKAADLWSLGLTLYELFTNGELPYGYENKDVAFGKGRFFQDLMKENPSSDKLEKPLKKARTPKRWRQLIARLARVKREDRITPEDIVADFPDLLGLGAASGTAD